MEEKYKAIMATENKKTVDRIRFTVELPREMHEQFKVFCVANRKMMGRVVEDLIVGFLDYAEKTVAKRPQKKAQKRTSKHITTGK